MREKTISALILVLAITTVAGSARAASDLWLHVTVDESDGAKVTVNLPVALAEKAIPMIPMHGELNLGRHADHHGIDLDEMRELWAEVKDSPDMTFVTVEDGSKNVRIWKKEDFVYVEVRNGDGEEVDVQVPLAVVDALFEGEEVDFSAAVEALAEKGGGDLVSVRDHDDKVRVWIDKTPEAR